jgi:hypothetical protein
MAASALELPEYEPTCNWYILLLFGLGKPGTTITLSTAGGVQLKTGGAGAIIAGGGAGVTMGTGGRVFTILALGSDVKFHCTGGSSG